MNENHLIKQLWALEAYANSAKILAHAKTPEELIQGVCNGITNQFPYVITWVGLLENNSEKTVRVAGISGKASDYAKGIVVSWDSAKPSGQGPTGRAINNGQSQVINDIQLDPKFAPWMERASIYGIRSAAAIPLFNGEQILGALMVYATEPDAFLPNELKLFESLAQEIGYGLGVIEERIELENERKEKEFAQKTLLESLELTIMAMASTMEMRDPYTSGHQRKVALIAEAIALEMGWDASKIQGLRMAGLIHDIGKISIPAEILTKPSKLTDLEYAMMKEHVTRGYLILKDIPFIWPIAEMIRQHHERIDGSGYPRGLKGDEILPEAKILAIADIIDSMSTHRPYRAALGVQRAIDEITSRKSKDLDSAVVEAAKRIFEEGKLQPILDMK